MGVTTKHKPATYYCYSCLHGFSREYLLVEHKPRCQKHEAQQITFPEEPWVTFKNVAKQLEVPFLVYADFEAFTTKINDTSGSTTKYQHHTPSGFGYKMVGTTQSKPAVIYRGPDVIENFLQRLVEEEEAITKILDDVKTMIITPQQEEELIKTVDCHISNVFLVADRVRDHCHLTGHFRGAAHNECNLKYKFKKDTKNNSFFIPVIFHNLRGYDSHLIMSAIGKYKKRKLNCIPNNMTEVHQF